MIESFEDFNNQPSSLEQEGLERQVEAETSLKEQELYQLVGSPEAEEERVEIVDANADEPCFMVERKITPREGEKEFLPEDSEMTVVMRGARKQKQEGSFWEVTEANFEMDGKELKLEDILPEGCRLVLNKGENNIYLRSEKTVSLNRLSEISDVVILLHEAGHAHDKSPRIPESEMPEEPNLEQIEEQTAKLIAHQQKGERNAWGSAHHTAREAGWPIQKIIKNRSAGSLATYDTIATRRLMPSVKYDQFASSEQRRAMKTPEKQQETRQLKELGQYTEDVPRLVSYYLDIPLDEILKKDEIQNDKSMKVRFYVPEENKHYIIDILQHAGERHEHVNSLSLTEVTSGKEGEPDDVATVIVHSSRMARVTEGKLQTVEEGPQLETKWEGKLGILEADENTKESVKTYQKAKKLLSKLEKENVGGRMIMETFRQMYPDASEPPNYDSETGKNLELEEKIAYMKKHSRIYNIMENLKKELNDLVPPEEE